MPNIIEMCERARAVVGAMRGRALVIDTVRGRLIVVDSETSRPAHPKRLKLALKWTNIKVGTLVPCASCGALTALSMPGSTVVGEDGTINARGSTALDRIAADHALFIVVDLATGKPCDLSYITATPSCAGCNGTPSIKEMREAERYCAAVARLDVLIAHGDAIEIK